MGQNALIRNVDLKRRILIVDDEAINRKILGHIVSRQYDVLYAENGKEALEIVREQGSMISLVLLDLLMPVMDGFELLGILHKDPEYKRIPVIVLTSDKSAEVRSLQLGAADFIPKPYDLPDVILARIRRSIELAEDNRLLKATETDALTGLFTTRNSSSSTPEDTICFCPIPRWTQSSIRSTGCARSTPCTAGRAATRS